MITRFLTILNELDAKIALALSRASAAGQASGGTFNSPTLTGTITTLGNVIFKNVLNRSFVLSPIPPQDFLAHDGLAHIAATIPIPAASGGPSNAGTRFDVFVQAVLGAGGYASGLYRVKCQNLGGAITATSVTTTDFDDVTGTGWTFVVAVSGTNITVTTTTANGALTSVVVQEVTGQA